MMGSPGKWSVHWRKTEKPQERVGLGSRGAETFPQAREHLRGDGYANNTPGDGPEASECRGHEAITLRRQSTKAVSPAPGARLTHTPKEVEGPSRLVGGVRLKKGGLS